MKSQCNQSFNLFLLINNTNSLLNNSRSFIQPSRIMLDVRRSLPANGGADAEDYENGGLENG